MQGFRQIQKGFFLIEDFVANFFLHTCGASIAFSLFAGFSSRQRKELLQFEEFDAHDSCMAVATLMHILYAGGSSKVDKGVPQIEEFDTYDSCIALARALQREFGAYPSFQELTLHCTHALCRSFPRGYCLFSTI